MTAHADASLAILPALQRLDALLASAAGLAGEHSPPESDGSESRGLVSGLDQVKRLLERAPATPLFGPNLPLAPFPDDAGRFAWLARTFGLDDFDLDVLMLALAPELDLRYERLYAWLQDDANRRCPSVDLALNLLCANAAERIERRVHFAVDAPLLQHRLIALAGDGTLLSRTIRLDEQLIRLLLGEQSLDSRLDAFATVSWPTRDRSDLRLAPETVAVLPRFGIDRLHELRLYFEGPDRSGASAVAEVLAGEANRPLLAIDLEDARTASVDLAALIPVLFREAWFRGAALFVAGLDQLRNEPRARARLHHELAGAPGLVMLAGDEPWRPEGGRASGVVSLPFPFPPASARRALWSEHLGELEVEIDSATLDTLAGNFKQTADRIADAALALQRRQSLSGVAPEPADFFAAARAQSSQELTTFARRITPVHRWDDLILGEDATAQLRALRDRVTYRERVLSEWGFARMLPLGRGLTVLFSGPSGTGKTMAAEVIAGELGLDLFKIDLATIVSKYIGETEKNLEAVFNAAARANGILFFDEADAIFGKRSDVKDAHDRYANLEIAYLLQKMEQFDGVAILATNLRDHLDDAFLRRLQIVIDFPLPDEVQRARMWRAFLPAEAPLDPEIDFAALAQRFRLSGGNIKNIVVSAAYGAAANGGQIDTGHLLQATRREHQKIGRRMTVLDLDGALAGRRE
jgi:AAA+ superfamily predicted ATPase